MKCPFCGSDDLTHLQIHECQECGAQFQVYRLGNPPKKGK